MDGLSHGLELRGIYKAGNSGMVNIIAAAAVNYILHTLPTDVPTTAKLRKIMWYNNTGGATVMQFGYISLAAAFVQVLPDIWVPANLDGYIGEVDIPAYEWRPDTTLVTGTLGDIVVQATAILANQIRIIVEVEELRAG